MSTEAIENICADWRDIILELTGRTGFVYSTIANLLKTNTLIKPLLFFRFYYNIVESNNLE